MLKLFQSDKEDSSFLFFMLRACVRCQADFEWRDNVHGSSQRWLLWVEDQDNEYMYHSETVIMTKKQAKQCPLVR